MMTDCYIVEVSEGECGSTDVSGGVENVATSTDVLVGVSVLVKQSPTSDHAGDRADFSLQSAILSFIQLEIVT